MDPLDGVVTTLGKLMNSLPIDPHLTRLVVFGYIFGVLSETIRIAALSSFENHFINAPGVEEQWKKYCFKLIWSNGTFSDSIFLLRTLEVRRLFSPEGFFKAMLVRVRLF